MGKQIRIFLENGTPTGIRHYEIVNWTGRAVCCPRNRISELKTWEYIDKPSIYFLFGSEQVNPPLAYVGETESAIIRINTHIEEKEFWQHVVIFSSTDENLTKAHIKYLEHKSYSEVKLANRYILDNGNTPTESGLPRADRDSMDEYYTNMKILLGVCGFLALEPLAPSQNLSEAEKEKYGTDLYLSVSGIQAKACLTDEGFIVLQGSEAATQQTDALSKGYRRRREELIEEKIMTLGRDRYLFNVAAQFSSPSEAAAIIVGYNINGRTAWKDKMGRSLNEIESLDQ